MAAFPSPSVTPESDLVAAAFEMAGVGLCVLDESSRLIHANPQFCSMLGYSPSEIDCRSWPELVFQDTAVRADERAMPKDPHAAPREWRLRRKDGSPVTALVGFRSVEQRSGRRAIVVTLTGIEARGHSDALLRSEANYRAAIDWAPIGTVIIRNNQICLANRMMTEMFGYANDELLSRPSFLDYVHPEDRPRMSELGRVQIGAPQGRRAASTFRVVRKDGVTRWAEGSAVQVQWEGRPATLAFIVDITERRNAEAALRHSEQRYRHVIENAGEGLLIVGRDRRPLFGNHKLEEITGYTLAEIYQAPFDAILWDEDRAVALERFDRRMEGERLARTYEFRLKYRDGHPVWVQVSATRVEWDGVPAILAFVSDITARHQVEETLRSSVQQYRDVVNNTAEGIVVVEGDRFAFVNPSFPPTWNAGGGPAGPLDRRGDPPGRPARSA
jgi:PAS domain S-box-containing protein